MHEFPDDTYYERLAWFIINSQHIPTTEVLFCSYGYPLHRKQTKSNFAHIWTALY